MRINSGVGRGLGLALLLWAPASFARAQAVDAAGHYEGTISAPGANFVLQIDLTPNPAGGMQGTLTIPAQRLKGFPLSNVVVSGKDVSFDVISSGGGSFRGELNGQTLAGEFSTQMGAFPLDLERGGEVRLYPAPTSARVSQALEGTWRGTLNVGGGLRVVLRLENRPDGTAVGALTSLDEDNMVLPVAIVEDGTRITFSVPMIGSSYAGTLASGSGELSGTYTTSQGAALPLSLKHSGAN
jgi:hypothetical protein